MKKLRISKQQLKRLERQKKEEKLQAALNNRLPVAIIAVLFIAIITGMIIGRYKFGLLLMSEDIQHIEDTLTNNGAGIRSSDVIQPVTDTVSVKSSHTFMVESAEDGLQGWKDMQNLGLFSKSINGDHLWSLFYTIGLNDYESNTEMLTSIANWYDSLNNGPHYTTTCTDPDCQFVAIVGCVVTNPTEEIIMSNAHATYHAQIEDSLAALSLSDEEWQAAYEAYLMSSPELIKSIKIKTVTRRLDMTNSNIINWAYYGNPVAVNFVCGNIVRVNTYTKQEDIKTLLNNIDITLDENVLDKKLIDRAPELLMLYGTSGRAINLGDTYVQNITGIDNVETYLKEQADDNSYLDITQSYKWFDIGCGIVYWDILEVEHIDNIPTFDEMMANEAWRREVSQQIIEGQFWNNVYSQHTSSHVDFE